LLHNRGRFNGSGGFGRIGQCLPPKQGPEKDGEQQNQEELAHFTFSYADI
jgi:hypothetical protein